MTWQTTTATAPAFSTAAGQNSALKNALSSVSVPVSPAESGSLQSTAAADTTRTDLNQYAAIQQITVTPYTHGGFNGSKHSMAWHLSTADAQAIVAESARRAGWPAVVLVMLQADQIAAFNNQLQQLAATIPQHNIRTAARRAQALNSHDQEKLFIKSSADQTAATAHWRTYRHAENVAAIAEAIASDTNPAALLTEYKNRRDNDIAETAPGNSGTIPAALYLTGDIYSQLNAITPPYPAAPLTAIFGWAGSVEDIAAIKGELGL